MAQAGGSATIYGILYQILGVSHWAATITLNAHAEGQAITDAVLVIEPKGGGGDVVVSSGDRRIVEQWKAKQDQGAWSVRSLVEEVLPDLYRAIKEPDDGGAVEYRFVSEGRMGRWPALNTLLDRLRGVAEPLDPLAALDDAVRRRFLPGSELTDQAFFEWVTTKLRKHAVIKKEPLGTTQKKLWHLLARFRMIPMLALERVEAELDHLLLGAVDYREQVPGKRRELSGLVLELAGQGEVTIAPEELFLRAGIKAKSFRDWTAVQERLRVEVAHRLRSEWHYIEELDVRTAPDWPANRPVLILTGESGQGKTWQLAALATQAAASKGLVAIASATGDAKRDLQEATNLIWQSVLQHDQELAFDRLTERLREIKPEFATTPLTIMIDDVQSVETARSLLKYDWQRYGGRLAISTLPSIALALQSQFGDLAHVVEVNDFSLYEATEFLRRCGHDWGMLQPDVREILKRPLVARLFAELATQESWLPTHEYQLFEKFWLRIRDARNQASYPSDVVWMGKLTGTVLDESLPYPWSQAALVDFGLPNEVQLRLESLGWLRRLDGGRVEVWHDRVLNWAVAEELVARRKQGGLSDDDLSAIIGQLWGNTERRSGRYLGYVPLDTLWIIADPTRGCPDDVARIIEALEDAPGTQGYLDRLYAEHLPTLGERVIAGLVERLRSAPRGDGSQYPYVVANAIEKIGLVNPAAATACGRTLIAEADRGLRQVGLRVLAIAPDSAQLDRIWHLHGEHCEEKHSKAFRFWWSDYDASFSALRAGLKLRPDWLSQVIDNSDPKVSPLHELAYLLATLEGEPARRLWDEKKATLFAKVPTERRRCLARCIEHFHDASEAERLEEWLTATGDLVAATSLMALVRIAPQRALNGLKAMDPDELYMCRGWWLGQLAAKCPGETQSVIRDLMVEKAASRWTLAMVYQGSMYLMDEATLRLLLDNLDELATARLGSPADTGIDFYRPSMLIASVASPHLLPVLESYAGSSLEKRLLTFATSRLNRNTEFFDQELESVRSILLKIGGAGLTGLVNAELGSTSKYSRLDGVEKALMRPDSRTRDLLKELVDDEECWGPDGPPYVQQNAAVMLAALGENVAVVRSTLRWNGILQELSDVRHGMAPMTDADLEEAVSAIARGDDEQRTRAMWSLSISGRSDLAPIVIKVLKHANPSSKLAENAVWALGDLACRDVQAAELIKPHLRIKGHKYAAICALARIGTAEALAILEDHLAAHGLNGSDFHDNLLAANLSRRPSLRDAVGDAVWRVVQADASWGGLPELFDCLPSQEDPKVREWLLQEAYEPDDMVRTSGRRDWIIRALAKADPDEAIRACGSGLSAGVEDSRLLAATLVELSSSHGVALACKIAAGGAKASVRYSVGRALRLVEQPNGTGAELGRLLRSEYAAERKVALELAGWAGPCAMDEGEVLRAIEDPSSTVRDAAYGTLRRHATEIEAIKLISLFKESSGPRAWSLLDAILNAADPHAVQTKGDRLYLFHSYPSIAVPYWLFCRKQLKRRIKEVEKELDDMDRKKQV